MSVDVVLVLSDEALAALARRDGESRRPPAPVVAEVHGFEDVGDKAHPDLVPRTERLELSAEQPAATASFAALAGGVVTLSLLASDGSEASSRVLKVANGRADYAIGAADVRRLADADVPPPADGPRAAVRTAQLVAIGSVAPDFAAAHLAVAQVGSEVFAQGGPLAGSGLAADRLAAIDASPDLVAALAALAWTPTHIGVDGRFSATFDAAGANAGWLWWLSGKRALAGFVPDDFAAPRAGPLAIALPAPLPGAPPPSAGADCADCGRDVPPTFTEAEVADNPGVYTEDPGAFCKPFSNPERVLSEKSFAVIARVQQPDIGAGGSGKVHGLHLLDFDPKVLDATLSTRRSGAASARGAVIDALAGTRLPVRHLPAAEQLEEIARLPSGRTTMSARQPLQWEDDVAQYQAATVALGHIIEFRVRSRSNGYSLGTVASTLTLAPRQTKRIQKVAFERIERAERRERTELTDQTNDSVVRERDYNDTVSAYLTEWASGSSSSGSAAAAGGIGFAVPPIIGGVGGGASKAWSQSEQEGGRNTTASELQRLRDSIRRHGDAQRRLDSTVVTEVSQSETVTGTTEIVRNPNYGHSLTIIYYQILRHLKVTTEFGGVRECLFVPFSIRPFTLQRAYRWREAIGRYVRSPRFAPALKSLRDVITDFQFSSLKPGPRAQQPLTFLQGSLYLTLGIARPEDSDGKFDAAKWLPLSPFLGTPALGIWSLLAGLTEAQRDAAFQRDHAPAIAARWANTIRVRASGADVSADTTLASRYGFNQTVRVDFTVPADRAASLNRALLATVHAVAGAKLPPGSTANLTRVVLRYGTASFERTIEGRATVGDLVDPETGVPDPDGAQQNLPTDAWDAVDEQQQLRAAAAELVEHLNEHLEWYHKAIWWCMDRDRLFMMLDGFYVPGTDRVSIASVVDREPVAIIGNCLVYPVGAASYIGYGKVDTPARLHDLYAQKAPVADPILLSLPTDGLYAQTIMDECLGLEEHGGSTDWVLGDKDPELGTLDPSLLGSRRSDPTVGVTPTDFPGTIINLQNAPEAPAPSGLAGALSAVTNAGAFRDMAGLAGTQANAAAALTTAAGLATTFGNQAAAIKLAEIAKAGQATQNANPQLAAIKNAQDKGLVSAAEAGAHANGVLAEMYGKGATGAPGEEAGLEAAVAAGRGVKTARSDGDGLRTVEIAPASFAGSSETAEAEVTTDDDLLGGGGGDGDADAPVGADTYGGYDLRRGDKDAGKRWAAKKRKPATDAMPADGAQGFVRQLQDDLVTLGFTGLAANGVFDIRTEWSLREFQIAAAGATVAVQAAPPPPGSRYADSLAATPNTAPYTGPISGVLNADTRAALRTWLGANWRCPVVVEAWSVNAAGARTNLVAGNLWWHKELQDAGPRVFVRDLSGRYPLPAAHPAADTHVLGSYYGYGTEGGPGSVPPKHTWPEAEILPNHVLFPHAAGGAAPTLAQLTAEERATFKVIRAVSEVECNGFYDGMNGYDNVFISLGTFHTPLGEVGEAKGGELNAILSLFAEQDPAAFDEVLGYCGVRADKPWAGDGAKLFTAAGQRRFLSKMATQRDDGSYVPLPTEGAFNDVHAEHDWFRNWHWFHRWMFAARTSPEFQRAIYDYARVRLREILQTPWNGSMVVTDPFVGMKRRAQIGDFYTSERAVALLLRWHVRAPAHVISNGTASGILRSAYARSGVALGTEPLTAAVTTETDLVAGLFAERAAQLAAAQAALAADPNSKKKQALVSLFTGLEGTLTHVRFFPRWAPVAINPNGGEANSAGYALDPAIGPLSMTRTPGQPFALDTGNLPVSPYRPSLWVP
jgi:hypothetical protein